MSSYIVEWAAIPDYQPDDPVWLRNSKARQLLQTRTGAEFLVISRHVAGYAAIYTQSEKGSLGEREVIHIRQTYGENVVVR